MCLLYFAHQLIASTGLFLVRALAKIQKLNQAKHGRSVQSCDHSFVLRHQGRRHHRQCRVSNGWPFLFSWYIARMCSISWCLLTIQNNGINPPKYSSREQFPDPGCLGASPCCPPPARALPAQAGAVSPRTISSQRLSEYPQAPLLTFAALPCSNLPVARSEGRFAMTEEPWASSRGSLGQRRHVVAVAARGASFWHRGSSPRAKLTLCKIRPAATCRRDAAGTRGQGPASPALAQSQQHFRLSPAQASPRRVAARWGGSLRTYWRRQEKEQPPVRAQKQRGATCGSSPRHCRPIHHIHSFLQSPRLPLQQPPETCLPETCLHFGCISLFWIGATEIKNFKCKVSSISLILIFLK